MTGPASQPEYLVRYGRPAFVGRFAAAAAAPARGDRVLVRSPRGVEVGTVLCEAADRFTRLIDDEPPGDLLRVMSADDESAAARAEERAVAMLGEADRLLPDAALPLSVLDAEVFFDHAAAVLHVVPLAACDATPFLDALSERVGLPVKLFDVSRTETVADPKTGCGKPDCGSGGGGCSTGGCSSGGGCSRGQVKSADELTAYFADLRRKMEAAGRVPLA